MGLPIYLELETNLGKIEDKEQEAEGFKNQLFVQQFSIGASIKGANLTNSAASSSSIPIGENIQIKVGMGSYVPGVFDSCFKNAQIKTATFKFVRTKQDQQIEVMMIVKATNGSICKAEFATPPFWESQHDITKTPPQLLEVQISYKHLEISNPVHSQEMSHQYSGITVGV